MQNNAKYSKVFILEDGVELLIYLDFASEEVSDTEDTIYCLKVVCFTEDVIATITQSKDTKENILQKMTDFTEEKAISLSYNLLKLYTI